MHKYRMLKEMEEGGTFVMHKAKHVKKDQCVAIKILKKKFYSIEDCRNNKEVQVLQKLNHTNVLKMTELINDSNELLMVFEYMPDNLKRVMKKRDSPFTELQTKIIMHQVIKGLKHIHKMGFIHRNLRPDILLCNEEADVVKISDFAMAKSFLDPLGNYTLSPPWYLAPEVLLGATNYSMVVDMWAAGCIMAEFLTGKPLLPGTEVRDQMRKICFLIGTFTPREWPDGAMLRRSIDYSLPKDTKGMGLEEGGVKASPEAKGMISDMLTWAPEKRASAEQALNSEFFKSDGKFENSEEGQEKLDSFKEKLLNWEQKWGSDWGRGSHEEFDSILSEFSNKSNKSRQKSRHTFAGFENSNPLMGDSTPRGRGFQHQQTPENFVDDPFRREKPKPAGGQRTYPIDNRSMDTDADKNPFEKDLILREARRNSRQASQGSQPPNRSSDVSPVRGDRSPRRMNESPRKRDSDLFGAGPDARDAEIEMKTKQNKAEKMKEQNYLKYRMFYGDDFMRNMLGGKPSGDNTGGSRSQAKDGNDGNAPAARGRYKTPRRPDTDLFGEAEGIEKQCVNEMKNKELKAKKMKRENYLRFRAKYGDRFMRSMLGGNQTSQEDSDREQHENSHEENGGMSTERRSRVNRPKDTDLFPGDPSESEYEEMKRAKNEKAEKLKHENYLKYRAKYGDGFMRSMLGTKDGDTMEAETEREDLNLHWDASPRRRRESPRRKDADLFNAEVDYNANNEELKIRQVKAERLREQNYLKYKDKYGYDLMRQTLSGNTDEQAGENEKPNHQSNRRTGRNSSRRNIFGPDRNRRPIGHVSRKNSTDKFRSIDHKARSEKLKSQNPLKHNAIYGDDFMRCMVGGNPREQKIPTEKPTQLENGSHEFNGEDHQGMDSIDNYSPSWS